MSALPRGWEHESLFDEKPGEPPFDLSERRDEPGLAGLSREDLELPDFSFPGFDGAQPQDGWGFEFPGDEPGQLPGRTCGTPDAPLPELPADGGCFPTLPATPEICDPGIMPLPSDATNCWH